MKSIYDRIDLEKLHPLFKAKLLELEENLIKRGTIYIATVGVRTWDEQQKLYDIGRKPGVGKPGHFVTKAKPGFSMHNYGGAADMCSDEDDDLLNGLQPDYDKENYEALAEEAEKVGLETGHRWSFSDSPHIQIPIGKIGLSINDLVHLYESGDLSDVWDAITKAWNNV